MYSIGSVGLQTTEIWGIHLGPIFATRKAVAPFSNIQSSWADQYGSIDMWNIKIRPLVIILWPNILGHQQGALNSLLTTIPNRNYRANRSGLILQKKIRKFAQNKQTSRQTDRQRIQLQRPLLSPVDRRGERANKFWFFHNGHNILIILRLNLSIILRTSKNAEILKT